LIVAYTTFSLRGYRHVNFAFPGKFNLKPGWRDHINRR